MVISEKLKTPSVKIAGLSLVWIILFGALVTQSGILSASAIESDPFSPRNLDAVAISDTQVYLVWDPPINATGVTGYQIEYKINSNPYSILSLTGNLTTYLHTGLLTNTTYTYRVSTIASSGISTPSNESSTTTLSVPSIPRNLSSNVTSSSQINLSWIAPSNDGGIPITGYLIQRNGTTIVNNTSSNKTTYIDTNLLPFHQQTYQVAAWNGIGLGAFSNSFSGITNSTIISSIGNETNQTSTNLGQLISNLEHQRNQLLKQQRQENLVIIHDCHVQIKNATLENKTQIIQDCKIKIKESEKKYKDLLNQIKIQLGQLRTLLKLQIHEDKNEQHSVNETRHLENEIKHSKHELPNLANMTKHFEKNSENQNNYLGNMTKYSEKNLSNSQNIINHFEQKSWKQNNQDKHNRGNGQQGNHENDD